MARWHRRRQECTGCTCISQDGEKFGSNLQGKVVSAHPAEQESNFVRKLGRSGRWEWFNLVVLACVLRATTKKTFSRKKCAPAEKIMAMPMLGDSAETLIILRYFQLLNCVNILYVMLCHKCKKFHIIIPRRCISCCKSYQNLHGAIFIPHPCISSYLNQFLRTWTHVHVGMACHRPSVCLSVTFVHPTRAIEILGNVSTPFGTLAINWHPGKILQRSFLGNPSVGGYKHEG